MQLVVEQCFNNDFTISKVNRTKLYLLTREIEALLNIEIDDEFCGLHDCETYWDINYDEGTDNDTGWLIFKNKQDAEKFIDYLTPYIVARTLIGKKIFGKEK